jgi:hypothetical protein
VSRQTIVNVFKDCVFAPGMQGDIKKYSTVIEGDASDVALNQGDEASQQVNPGKK